MNEIFVRCHLIHLQKKCHLIQRETTTPSQDDLRGGAVVKEWVGEFHQWQSSLGLMSTRYSSYLKLSTKPLKSDSGISVHFSWCTQSWSAFHSLYGPLKQHGLAEQSGADRYSQTETKSITSRECIFSSHLILINKGTIFVCRLMQKSFYSLKWTSNMNKSPCFMSQITHILLYIFNLIWRIEIILPADIICWKECRTKWFSHWNYKCLVRIWRIISW
jgi:hypothetical protein